MVSSLAIFGSSAGWRGLSWEGGAIWDGVAVDGDVAAEKVAIRYIAILNVPASCSCEIDAGTAVC